MKPIILVGLFLFALILTSCNQQQQDTQNVAMEVDRMQIPPPNQKEADIQPQSVPESPIERKIIKQGTITFETRNARTTGQRIAQAVAANEGFITEESQSEVVLRLEHRVSIRVPAPKFDALLEAISKGADTLKSKTITAQDVTEEYVDVESRIKTKKELENRYQQLLQKATKVEEMLAIEREMGTLRTDIESIEGRLRYLKDRVAFSTLTVIYYETSTESVGFLDKVGDALGSGWNNLLGFLVALITLWPFLLIIAVSLFLLIRHRQRKAAKG